MIDALREERSGTSETWNLCRLSLLEESWSFQPFRFSRKMRKFLRPTRCFKYTHRHIGKRIDDQNNEA